MTVMSDLEKCAMKFALAVHAEDKYGNEPYEVHLREVVQLARDLELGDSAYILAWLHDTLETKRISKQDLVVRFGSTSANCVEDMTGVGETRKECTVNMHGKLLTTKRTHSVAVKFCDRVVNLRRCKPGDKFAVMYLKEHSDFERILTNRITSSMMKMYLKEIKRLTVS